MGITEGHSFINVLYVDDEPELLEIGKIFLEKDGNFIIDILTSADEALDSLAAKQYDAIVSDYQMPGMDGIEFLKQLKSSGDNTPFIIFTGRGREDVVIEALNNGADFYIQKGGEPKSQFAELSNKIRYAVTRRRAEESLENVVRKLTLSQQVAHLGNWTFDIKEQKFVGSDEAARIFGYPSGYRASYQEIASQVHPDDRPVAREAFERLIKTGEPYNIDLRIYQRDTGDMRFIRSKGQILKFENGQPALIFGIDMDITDQKLTEEKLIRNNEELKASFDQITATEEELRTKLEELIREEQYWKISSEATIHPIFIMDSGQRILQLNSAVEKVFGIKADEATSKHCWEVVHRTSGPLPGCPFIRMQETLSRETMELSFNDRIHVVTVDPILDENGVLVGAVHNIRDITNFRFTEAALRENKNKFRELFNNSTDAIAIHDTDGRFLEVNDTICERLGYSRDELIGKTPSDIDAPEYAAAVPDLINRVLTDHLLTFETVHITKGGRRIPVEVSSRPITYQGKRAVISTGRDITSRKQAEEALRQTNRKLKILSSITRHDIKNSIMAAYGYLDLISEANPTEQEEYLDKTRGIIQKINRQIEFTRLYENLGTKDPKWQKIRNIIKKLDVPESVLLHISGLEEEIFADLMLWKVFENLLDDSVNHGQYVTEIKVSSRQSDDRLTIIWEDNGIGIPSGEKEKIFEQGFGKNTGMGLFLSCEILSITGIGIKETGEPGKGSRFEITVPEEGYRYA